MFLIRQVYTVGENDRPSVCFYKQNARASVLWNYIYFSLLACDSHFQHQIVQKHLQISFCGLQNESIVDEIV